MAEYTDTICLCLATEDDSPYTSLKNMLENEVLDHNPGAIIVESYTEDRGNMKYFIINWRV